MINETLEADRAYQRDKDDAYNRGYAQGYKDAKAEQTGHIKGRWIPADTMCGIKCSACGLPVDDFCYSIDYIDLDYNPNFCPNCGAKMEREVTT